MDIEENGKTYAIYTRFPEDTPEMLAELKRVADARLWLRADSYRADPIEEFAEMMREQMLKDVVAHRFDVLVVWSLARLGKAATTSSIDW